MEIKSTNYKIKKVVRFCVVWTVLFMILPMTMQAQPPIKNYSVKNNRMYIAIGKQLPDASIDSFITQYRINDLNLKKFVRGMLLDSLRILGWHIDLNNDEVFIISKPLAGLKDINEPGVKFNIPIPGDRPNFPAVSNTLKYGYNQFRNKQPFRIQDNNVTFFLRGKTDARKVNLAGSFNDWKPDALSMTPTDSGWIATVKLTPGKYWYKFIIDGRWTTDPDNRISENDGRGNTNSVFFRTNTVFRLQGFANAKKVYVSGSFNNWQPAELAMTNTNGGWELPVYLAEGTHTYRFVVDRRWMEDPANPEKYPNEFNEFNSVIRIGKPFLFFLEGHPDAKKVVLTGSFNNWRQDELFLTRTAKGWEIPYTLGPGNYEYNFIIDGKWNLAPATPNGTQRKGSGNFYFVIQPNHTFVLKGFPKASDVFLAGEFNNWSPNTFAMKKQGDDWVLDVHLSPGKHLYKFVVDGKWIIDPSNKLWEQNEHNTGNSVIWIEQ